MYPAHGISFTEIVLKEVYLYDLVGFFLYDIMKLQAIARRQKGDFLPDTQTRSSFFKYA